MPKKLISIRVSDHTDSKIKTLAERLQTSQAEIVARAMELFYRSENTDWHNHNRPPHIGGFFYANFAGHGRQFRWPPRPILHANTQ